MTTTRTANDHWWSMLVLHRVLAGRHADHITDEALHVLSASDERITRLVRTLFAEGLTPARVEKSIDEIVKLREESGWSVARKRVAEAFTEFAGFESGFHRGLFGVVTPVQWGDTLAEAATVLALTTAFHGRTLRQWLRDTQRAETGRLTTMLRASLSNGLGASYVTATLGTTANHIRSVVRTGVAHVSEQSLASFVSVNKRLFGTELFVAVLDNRTTPVCQANDGRRFPAGEGPIPPLHFGCRSIRTPAIASEAVGERPAREATQAMLEREYAKRQGWEQPLRRADLPRGHKGTFDAFARQRIRELTGVLPAKVTFTGWLRGLPVQTQDDILGVTRGRLFRAGKLELTSFVDALGKRLTLVELAKSHRAAFLAAGLDVSGYTE